MLTYQQLFAVGRSEGQIEGQAGRIIESHRIRVGRRRGHSGFPAGEISTALEAQKSLIIAEPSKWPALDRIGHSPDLEEDVRPGTVSGKAGSSTKIDTRR